MATIFGFQLLQRRRFVFWILILLYVAVVVALWGSHCGSSIVIATTTTASKKTAIYTNNDDDDDDDDDGTDDGRDDTPPSPAPPRDDFLLNVPFYVYDNDLLWINKTYFGDNNSSSNNNTDEDNFEKLQEFLETRGASKHSDDYWFAHAALYQHPQRTFNPAQAKLFVVPLLLNTMMTRLQYQRHMPTMPSFCIKNVGCEKQTILSHMNHVLQESIWFQRHDGRDHVVMASHFHFAYSNLSKVFPSIVKCNMITFEGSTKLAQKQQKQHNTSNPVVVLPSMYVGHECPIQRIKTDDVVMVGALTGPQKPKRNLVHLEHRREMCEWLRQLPQHDGSNNTTSSTTTQAAALRMSICGEGTQCPALANARFGMHVRGDTFGANRLLDTLLSGTVPIFTWPQQYDILPDWIDWKALSYFANVTDEASFMTDMRAILNDDQGYQKKLELVLRNRNLFDWKKSSAVPFDMYMHFLSVRLWPLDPDIVGRPPNKKVMSRYTALILPESTT